MRKVGRKNMVAVGVVFTALLLVCLGGLIWAFLDRHSFYCPVIRRERCIENLALIAKAKESYRADHELTNGAPVEADQLVDYITGGWKHLRCPGKGTYTIGPIGTPPACSEPDHKR